MHVCISTVFAKQAGAERKNSYREQEGEIYPEQVGCIPLYVPEYPVMHRPEMADDHKAYQEPEELEWRCREVLQQRTIGKSGKHRDLYFINKDRYCYRENAVIKHNKAFQLKIRFRFIVPGFFHIKQRDSGFCLGCWFRQVFLIAAYVAIGLAEAGNIVHFQHALTFGVDFSTIGTFKLIFYHIVGGL